jgi:type VI secretion system protein ImpH
MGDLTELAALTGPGELSDLTGLLRHQGRFNVFQLLRLIQRQPDLPEVRFRADLSAGFPGREFSDVRLNYADDGRRRTAQITTSNYCIAGALGPLPETYTEWLRDQQRAKKHGAGDFLDIYNHRINKLRFGLKAEMLPELNAAPPQRCDHAQRLAALMGLGSTELAQQVKLPPRAWLALAALLGDGRRSAANIERAMNLVFDNPATSRVKLDQLIGTWRPIEDEDLTQVAVANTRLGRSSVLGRRVWDQQARVRITLSGWNYERACQHLPPERRAAKPRGDGPPMAAIVPRMHRHLCGLVWLLLDREYDCEVHIQLHGSDVPASRLTSKPDRKSYWGLRLGQTAWLRSKDGHNGHSGGAEVRFLIPAFEAGGQP